MLRFGTTLYPVPRPGLSTGLSSSSSTLVSTGVGLQVPALQHLIANCQRTRSMASIESGASGGSRGEAGALPRVLALCDILAPMYAHHAQDFYNKL